jgi:hypothetical protein
MPLTGESSETLFSYVNVLNPNRPKSGGVRVRAGSIGAAGVAPVEAPLAILRTALPIEPDGSERNDREQSSSYMQRRRRDMRNSSWLTSD